MTQQVDPIKQPDAAITRDGPELADACKRRGLEYQAVSSDEATVTQPSEVKMSDTTVWTFFYGSNINLDILKAVDYIPKQIEVARLHGFDIQIRPLANLMRSDRHCVYGILATGTHDELNRLYGRYVHGELGVIYLPHAVLCERLDGTLLSALCYLCPEMEPAPATNEYLDRIVGPARTFGLGSVLKARSAISVSMTAGQTPL